MFFGFRLGFDATNVGFFAAAALVNKPALCLILPEGCRQLL